MKQLPSHIRAWLNARGIADSVIDEYGIDYIQRSIAIPVMNEGGEVLFYKFRRDPNDETGPKYRYQKGATSALFGVQSLKLQGPVVICEGELDALLLISHGIAAVSTTGGSGTFEYEWRDLLMGRDIYICYDFDKPGFKGALTVQEVIPWAKIMWLPSTIGEHGDITDFFKTNTKDKFIALMGEAKSYTVPEDWRQCDTKKALNALKNRYELQMQMLMEEARQRRARYQTDAGIQALLEMYRTEHAQVQRQIKYFRTTRDTTNPDRIAAAKAVPIPTYLKVGRDKTLKCIWHDEKTGSMHYYEKQNRVHCFGCGKGGDVIDVIQTINSCDLKTALQFILKDNG